MGFETHACCPRARTRQLAVQLSTRMSTADGMPDEREILVRVQAGGRFVYGGRGVLVRALRNVTP